MGEDYTMEQGDCMSSIAYGRGFFGESVASVRHFRSWLANRILAVTL
jgi:hypothetical protein